MSIESAADRRAFLADDGIVVGWQVGGAGPVVDVVALFDNGTVTQLLQESASALNRRGTLTMLEADLPAGGGGEADVVTVRAVTYHPKEPLPDGQGFLIVTLERIEP